MHDYLTSPIQISTIEVKANPRRLGRRIVTKKSQFRKYVCFIPMIWTIEEDSPIFAQRGLGVEKELIDTLVAEIKC